MILLRVATYVSSHVNRLRIALPAYRAERNRIAIPEIIRRFETHRFALLRLLFQLAHALSKPEVLLFEGKRLLSKIHELLLKLDSQSFLSELVNVFGGVEEGHLLCRTDNMKGRGGESWKARQPTAIVLYTGIDYHKRYSVLCTVDADGRRVRAARIAQNEPAAFAAYFQHLPAPSRAVLEAATLAGFDLLTAQIEALEATMAVDYQSDAAVARLRTLPGVGPILAAVIATEIDGIARFHRPEKLCAYAGLVPTTHASGGKIHHGPLLPFCNEWLRWAFIEASWSAVSRDPALSALYRLHRAHGKPGPKAITIIARRLCRIAWHLLHEQRNYTPNPPSLSPVAPTIY
jgi:hypothetical protein